MSSMVAAIPSFEPSLQDQIQISCRKTQLQQLAVYYNHQLPQPPVLVARGLKDTAKLETILSHFEKSKIDYAVVKCRECLSQRHLLTKIFAACLRQVGRTENLERYDRTDNINSLVINLRKLCSETTGTLVLVLDEVDKQHGASQTLLPSLARLGDMVDSPSPSECERETDIRIKVPNLTVLLTASSSRPLSLRRPGIPTIVFPPCTRAEAITIVTKSMKSLVPQDVLNAFPDVSEPQVSKIYVSFITTVYDALTSPAASISIHTFHRTCEKLWPRFIWPLVSGQKIDNKSGRPTSSKTRWDFPRLLARNRSLFQGEGENALLCSLTADANAVWSFSQLLSRYQSEEELSSINHTETPLGQELPLLNLFSTLLLVSSYLASHTPPKHDIIIFSRLSSSSTHKRRYLSSALSKSRTGSVRKTPTKRKNMDTIDTGGEETPSKKRKSVNENSEGLAGEKTPKSTRLLLEKTSNIPRPFTLERVVAILRTVHPEGLPRTKGAADTVYVEMAELERMRLVVRCAAHVGDGGARGDDGILEEKWRVNVGREFVTAVGKKWNIGLDGWEID